MSAVLVHVDDVLRARPWLVRGGGHARRLLLVAALMIVFGVFYGVVMGSFSGGRVLQMLYSGTKVPLLLAATFALSLPTFFVLNTLFGLRRDFAAAVRALAATQAGLTIILASFAPFTALWYTSFDNYDGAKFFNLAAFGAASLAAQGLLRNFYRPLIKAHARHRHLMWIWLAIYAFVGVQMAWVLRPFVGDPGTATTFFRESAWGNAYLEVAETVWRLLGK
jgi:hypothetical protein